MKITQGAHFLASANSSLTRAAPRPTSTLAGIFHPVSKDQHGALKAYKQTSKQGSVVDFWDLCLLPHEQLQDLPLCPKATTGILHIQTSRGCGGYARDLEAH